MPEPDLTPGIVTSAQGPRRAAGDSGSFEQHSIPDQIAADRYAKSQAGVATRKRGLRFSRLVSPPTYDGHAR